MSRPSLIDRLSRKARSGKTWAVLAPVAVLVVGVVYVWREGALRWT